MDILSIITTATTNHATPLPSLAATTGRISPLKWMHLCFVCGITMDAEVPVFWGEVVTAPIKK